MGVGAARNRGLREGRAEWIVFLDDDVCVGPGWLRGVAQEIERPGLDLIAGRVILKWEAARPTWWSAEFEPLLSICDHGEQRVELSRAQAVGANFAFRGAVIGSVGGFLEGLGRRGKRALSGEETEFLERALAAGFRMAYVPAMMVEHRIRADRARARYLSWVAYGNARSRVRYRPFLGSARIMRALFLKPLRIPVYSMIGAVHALRGRTLLAVRYRIARAQIRGRMHGTLDRFVQVVPPSAPSIRRSSTLEPGR